MSKPDKFAETMANLPWKYYPGLNEFYALSGKSLLAAVNEAAKSDPEEIDFRGADEITIKIARRVEQDLTGANPLSLDEQVDLDAERKQVIQEFQEKRIQPKL